LLTITSKGTQYLAVFGEYVFDPGQIAVLDCARHHILWTARLDDVALIVDHDIKGRRRIDSLDRYSCQLRLFNHPIQCDQRKALLRVRIPASNVGVRADEAFFDPNLAGRVAARTDGFERKAAPMHAVSLRVAILKFGFVPRSMLVQRDCLCDISKFVRDAQVVAQVAEVGRQDRVEKSHETKVDGLTAGGTIGFRVLEVLDTLVFGGA